MGAHAFAALTLEVLAVKIRLCNEFGKAVQVLESLQGLWS
jgi:hypothetical protein